MKENPLRGISLCFESDSQISVLITDVFWFSIYFFMGIF